MVRIEDTSGGAGSGMPASTAGTGAVSGQIQITIEAIRRIARDNLAQMRDNAAERSSEFVGLSLPPGAFSEVPVAQVVGRQHEAAQEVFARTIEGVIADLEAFAANLEASCAAHEATDEQSAVEAQRAGQGALTDLSSSMGDYRYRSDENFETAGSENSDELGEAPAETRDGSGAPGTTGTPAAPGGSSEPGDPAGFDGDPVGFDGDTDPRAVGADGSG